jgi:pimeloyl-ACP methyl ester carboxylesterase
VVLVGHSYGGPVITTVAERMPDRIRWARLQPRQLPAHARAARRNQAVVADHAAQPAGQNRRQDRAPRSLRVLPNDRGHGAACAVPDCPRRDYGSPAAAAGAMLRMPPRAVGVSIGGTSAPKSGAVDRKSRYFRLRCAARASSKSCERELFCQRFGRGPRSATERQDQRLSGESRLKALLVDARCRSHAAASALVTAVTSSSMSEIRA